MKTKFRILLAAITFFAGLVLLFAALALPLRLAAQDKQDHNRRHHHYRLIVIGTFGGPQSYVDGSGNGGSRVLNNHGTLTGSADTSTPDPYPNFCFNGDCFVSHTFQWQHGMMTDLGVLPGGASSGSTGISANGLIAGLSENGEIDPLIPGFPELRAVLWQNGGITDLGTLPGGGYESIATAVDSRGQVAGLALNTVPDSHSMVGLGYQTRAFLWQNGVMQDLGTLGGPDAQALAMNEQGQIIGVSYTSSTPTQAGPCTSLGFTLTTGAFLWQNGQMVNLGSLGGTCTTVSALPNDRGQVVGQGTLTGDQAASAFLWENGSIHQLDGSFGGHQTGAIQINHRGEAVGFGYLPGDTTFHAALWTQMGRIINLGAVGNDPCSFASAINAKTQVVGASAPDCIFSDSSAVRAFLWEDGSIFDLNTLIPSGSALHLQFPETINDRGEIAGTGSDANGHVHAFLLMPCDEEHANDEGCEEGDGANTVPQPLPAIRDASSRTLPPSLLHRMSRFHIPSLTTPNCWGAGRCIVGPGGRLNGQCLIGTPYGCFYTQSSCCPVGAMAIDPVTTECCRFPPCPPITIDLGRHCNNFTATPTPTARPTATPTATATPIATATPTATPTASGW